MAPRQPTASARLAAKPAGVASTPAAPTSPPGALPVATTGGGVISNNGAGLAGTLLAPATLIGNNGAGLVSDHGGGLVGNNGAGLHLLALSTTAAQVPYARATVKLVDAKGAAVLDANGQPISAVSDAQGHFVLPGVTQVADNQLLVAELPTGKGSLEAIVPKGPVPAAGVNLDLVSTLTTGYILDAYVKTQPTLDPVVVLDRLPADVEAATRAKAGTAVDEGSVPVPPGLSSAQIDATVGSLVKQNAALASQLDTVKQLLVIGLASSLATDGAALSTVIAPGAIATGLDGNLLRKMTSDGTVTTLAGQGVQGAPTGDNEVSLDDPVPGLDGQGAAASFSGALALAIDASGNMYVSDSASNLVRKVTPGGLVSTLPITEKNGVCTGLWVDGRTLWYIDGHQILPYQLP